MGEESLSQNKQKELDILSITLSNAPILIYALDSKGTVISVKGGELRDLGILESDCIGKVSFKIKNFPISKAHFRRAMTGEAFSATVNVNGVMYETAFEPMRDDDGNIIGCSGLSSNVTERIMLEELLDQSRFKAARMQQLNSLAGMANGIAHEINNPLAIISGYAQQIKIAAESGKPVDTKFLIARSEKLVSTSERINRIITALQSFSRDGGDDEFKEESVKDIFLETWEIIRSRAVKSGLDLDLDSVPDKAVFQVRKVQITQVIFNLLSNALDAVKENEEPKVTVHVQQVDKSIEIIFSDNGPGISDTLINKVWEPFYTSKDLSHAGMGLSTSKGIIEAHHGSIEYKRVDDMTRFVIKLPISQTDVKTKKEAS